VANCRTAIYQAILNAHFLVESFGSDVNSVIINAELTELNPVLARLRYANIIGYSSGINHYDSNFETSHNRAVFLISNFNLCNGSWKTGTRIHG